MTKEKAKYRGKLVEDYRAVRDVLPGLSVSTRQHYPTYIGRFCEFVGKTPDAIIKERHKHLRSRDERVRRTYEKLVLKFHDHIKEKLKIRETSAYQHISVLQGWFARHYARFDFGRRGPRMPRTEDRDYIPTLDEVREIVECSKVRGKAIFLTMLQSGIGPADICQLKRGWFERALKIGEYPAFIVELSREKTRALAWVCVGADAGKAIKRYLDLRTDDDPHLFVDLRRKVLTKDEKGNPIETEVRPLQPDYIDQAFQKSVKRSGVQVPNGLRLRVYSLRKIFETQAGRVMPQTWVDLAMGHSIAGARAAYIKPPRDDFLAARRKAEDLLSISPTVPTEKKIEAMVGKRTSELGQLVEELRDELRTVKTQLKVVQDALGDFVLEPTSAQERINRFSVSLIKLIREAIEKSGGPSLSDKDVIAYFYHGDLDRLLKRK